jgi:ferredoxin-NADP reductase
MSTAAGAAEAAPSQADAVSWPVFEAPLIGRELVAEGTMSFAFAMPPDWTFRAGQFVDITLIDPPTTDAAGNTRGFSVSSAPSENVITITTRLRGSAFKRSLQTVPLGTVVRIEGPFGELQLGDTSRPAVVLTGGIGVTPFRSMLVEAARHGGLAQRVLLVHSNRRPADAPFLAELQQLAQRDKNLTFVPTMTGLGPADQWRGERSRIDAQLLRHLLGDVSAVYYLTGPPGFVRAMLHVLAELGVPKADIRTEEFSGY